MDTKTKFRSLVEGMDDTQLGVMAGEVAAALDSRRKRITTEDITIDRLKDPAFAADVRAELEAVLKGMR
jgi:hypothetical protein